jgi:NitT/TauT family transport system permease protein
MDADARKASAAEHLIAAAVVLAALGSWWWFARGLPAFILPDPWTVFARLVALFAEPEFLSHTIASSWRVVLATLLALLIGGGLALLASWAPVAERIVHDRIKPALNSFPSIGWAILAAIWFESGHFSVIFVQVAILIPFCLINIAEGLRDLDRELIEMGRSFTRRRRRILGRLMLPMLVPYVVAGLRIAYGIAWKIALVAELLGSTSGLGYLMLRAQTTADTATVLAACFAIVLIFVAGEKLVLDPLARRVGQSGR